MAKGYRLTRKATADLRDIWIYTAGRWGERQADSYYSDIIRTIEALAAGKRDGRPVDVREGYLKYPTGKHFVFFRSKDSGIEIVRVLHQSMDVRLRL